MGTRQGAHFSMPGKRLNETYTECMLIVPSLLCTDAAKARSERVSLVKTALLTSWAVASGARTLWGFDTETVKSSYSSEGGAERWLLSGRRNGKRLAEVSATADTEQPKTAELERLRRFLAQRVLCRPRLGLLPETLAELDWGLEGSVLTPAAIEFKLDARVLGFTAHHGAIAGVVDGQPIRAEGYRLGQARWRLSLPEID